MGNQFFEFYLEYRVLKHHFEESGGRCYVDILSGNAVFLKEKVGIQISRDVMEQAYYFCVTKAVDQESRNALFKDYIVSYVREKNKNITNKFLYY